MSEEYSSDEHKTIVMMRQQERYEQNTPLVQLLRMSTGPLVYQVGVAIHDAVDMLLISRAFDDEVVQIIGFGSMIRYLCMSVAIFFSQACVGRSSGLIGESRFEEAGRVVVDVYRIAFFSMIVVPIIFYFLTKPILTFMGCTPEMAERALPYLTPILCMMPFIALFQISCGIIQSEGRSMLSGIMQLLAFVLNCGIFGPILLFAIKVDFKYAGISFALSQAIPGIILTCLMLSRKFDTQANWKMLIGKFTYETWEGIKLASPFIINVIAGTIPPVIMINFMMTEAYAEGIGAEVGAVYSVFLKIQPIINSFSIAFSDGMLSSGSYAHGSLNHKRFSKLLMWDFILNMVSQFIFLPLICYRPDVVVKIWLSDPASLKLSRKFVAIPFYSNWVNGVNESVTALLQCLRYSWTALIPSIGRGVYYIIFAFVFRAIPHNGAIFMLYAYVATDACILLTDLAVSIIPIRKVIQFVKQEKEAEASNRNSDENEEENSDDDDDDEEKDSIIVL